MKGREKWKGYIVLLWGICLLLFGSFAAYGAQPEDGETVKIGYYQSKDFQEGDGVKTLHRGYSYEYLQKVASYTGWQYEYVSGDWSSLYDKLLKGEIDMMAGVAYSEERSRQILYPQQEILKETFYIYKDSDDRSMKSGNIASFKGKKIGAVEDKRMLAAINTWKEENHAEIELVTYRYLAECAAAFNTREIDGFVSADNIVSQYTGITPVEIVGKQPYYLCVSKNREDLLKELNMAVEIMNAQDSLYLETLRNKYSADTSVAVFLSLQEQEWINSHPQVNVGCLKNYMPYSDTDADGNAAGLIADIIPDLFASLPGEKYEPVIQYQGFDSHEEMIEALKRGKTGPCVPCRRPDPLCGKTAVSAKFQCGQLYDGSGISGKTGR